jgi:hypothetical protein
MKTIGRLEKLVSWHSEITLKKKELDQNVITTILSFF